MPRYLNVQSDIVFKKFGSIPAEYQTRIEAANANILLHGSKNILQASTLADVFQN